MVCIGRNRLLFKANFLCVCVCVDIVYKMEEILDAVLVLTKVIEERVESDHCRDDGVEYTGSRTVFTPPSVPSQPKNGCDICEAHTGEAGTSEITLFFPKVLANIIADYSGEAAHYTGPRIDVYWDEEDGQKQVDILSSARLPKSGTAGVPYIGFYCETCSLALCLALDQRLNNYWYVTQEKMCLIASSKPAVEPNCSVTCANRNKPVRFLPWLRISCMECIYVCVCVSQGCSCVTALHYDYHYNSIY